MDGRNLITRNLQFMHVRVLIDLEAPLVTGAVLRRDDGILVWIDFRYKHMFKVCCLCGMIGHKSLLCSLPEQQYDPGANQQIQMKNVTDDAIQNEGLMVNVEDILGDKDRKEILIEDLPSKNHSHGNAHIHRLIVDDMVNPVLPKEANHPQYFRIQSMEVASVAVQNDQGNKEFDFVLKTKMKEKIVKLKLVHNSVSETLTKKGRWNRTRRQENNKDINESCGKESDAIGISLKRKKDTLGTDHEVEVRRYNRRKCDNSFDNMIRQENVLTGNMQCSSPKRKKTKDNRELEIKGRRQIRRMLQMLDVFGTIEVQGENSDFQDIPMEIETQEGFMQAAPKQPFT
ncbi:hypothetical protein PTKIN_Ptkin13bG0156300 [Pterospermum kingtungense]